MAVLCPSCRFALVEGALRCRACGADARTPLRSQGVAAGFRLFDVLDDEQERDLALLEELRILAPAVLLWVKEHPRDRARVIEILVLLYRG